MSYQVIFQRTMQSMLHTGFLVCWLLIFSGIAANYGYAGVGEQSAVQASPELLWTEPRDQGYALLHSQFSDNRWSEPEAVYLSDNPLTSPALGTDADGGKLLIWTEQLRRKTVLKSKRRTSEGAWQEAQVFSDSGLENFATSIVYDGNGQAWVFWSSAGGKLADIYLSRSDGPGWSRRERIHPENKVPDILPVASITVQGNVLVEWTHYSFAQRSYLLTSKEFTVENSEKYNNNSSLGKESADLGDLELPDFLPRNRRLLLHFPTHRMIQSRHLSLN